jgi:hypothetical protein
LALLGAALSRRGYRGRIARKGPRT